MGNISIPRQLLADLRFDEDLKSYGWEDIIFGYEFVKRGNKVYYSSSAKAFHWHQYQEKDFQSYIEQVGKSAILAEKKYPGVGFLPPLWKKLLFSLMITLGKIFRPLLSQRMKWYLDMKGWFLGASRENNFKF